MRGDDVGVFVAVHDGVTSGIGVVDWDADAEADDVGVCVADC